MDWGTQEERFATARPRRLLFFSRFDEPVPVSFYRWVGKLHVVVLTVLLTLNFASSANLDDAGLRYDVYWTGMAMNTPLVALDILIGLLMWRGDYDAPTLRRMNISCMLLEVASILLLLWGHGTANSHILVFSTFIVMLYRISFDFTTGFVCLVSLIVGQWCLLAAQWQGWIPSQPLLVDGASSRYPVRELGIMFSVTIVMVTAFVSADWTIARLRHKELAIRLLRESLAASDAGKVGRHTGRALKDTYLVGPLISAGGMGEVYRGHHRRTKRNVAIKILHPHLMEDELLLKRFRREAEITGQLGSPHIVEVIDVDRDSELAFLVLELLDGEDLKSRIDSERQLSLAEVDDVIGQAARGLAVAHAAGVVHRDLKPENLFLCKAGRNPLVKILDFGVSKIRGNATALTQEVALIGTPDFMAPEQARGQATDLDARTDVFALACIAYNMLTGERPFKATSVPALLRRICDEEPPPLSSWRTDVPEPVASVLRIAMAKRQHERYADVSAFHRDLSAALAGTRDDKVLARAAAVHLGEAWTGSAVSERTISGVSDTVAANSATDDTLAQA